MPKQFKIGSHDSMTYAKAKDWWLRPFQFVARCQSVSIEEQYEKYGVRLFDLRFKFDKKHRIYFAHGSMKYKANIASVLNYLGSRPEKVYVRVLCENKLNTHIEDFIKVCSYIERRYPTITFFGGMNKHSFANMMYNFKGNADAPSFLDKYSSVNNETKNFSGTKLDDWFPWLYARFHNKKNIEAGTDRDFLLIDFVNIR